MQSVPYNFIFCGICSLMHSRQMQGSARDLGAVRGHMQLAQPDLDFLMSKCNQDRTSDGLHGMGRRLAAEVVQYLQVLVMLI